MWTSDDERNGTMTTSVVKTMPWSKDDADLCSKDDDNGNDDGDCSLCDMELYVIFCNVKLYID